jgi:hypothetical protein
MRKILLLLSLFFFSTCCFSQSRYISQRTKKIVFTRDGGRCQCCGSFESLEYDHIMPYSCGGRSDPSNIQLLCRRCNRSKSNSCYCKVHNRLTGINCCDKKTNRTGSYSSGGQVRSGQCTGTTKKGLRCRKMTTDPSGRCHFHQ